MTQKEWHSAIEQYCEAAGTYRPFFNEVIDTLAGILERRDEALRQFEVSGGHVIVAHTNKAGATNLEQNPALRAINDMNRDALAYWRDLGLTPAGLKKIDEQALKGQKKSGLSEILKGIGS